MFLNIQRYGLLGSTHCLCSETVSEHFFSRNVSHSHSRKKKERLEHLIFEEVLILNLKCIRWLLRAVRFTETSCSFVGKWRSCCTSISQQWFKFYFISIFLLPTFVHFFTGFPLEKQDVVFPFLLLLCRDWPEKLRCLCRVRIDW